MTSNNNQEATKPVGAPVQIKSPDIQAPILVDAAVNPSIPQLATAKTARSRRGDVFRLWFSNALESAGQWLLECSRSIRTRGLNPKNVDAAQNLPTFTRSENKWPKKTDAAKAREEAQEKLAQRLFDLLSRVATSSAVFAVGLMILTNPSILKAGTSFGKLFGVLIGICGVGLFGLALVVAFNHFYKVDDTSANKKLRVGSMLGCGIGLLILWFIFMVTIGTLIKQNAEPKTSIVHQSSVSVVDKPGEHKKHLDQRAQEAFSKPEFTLPSPSPK